MIAPTGRQAWSRGVDRDATAKAFMIAREFIAMHGDAVTDFLEAKIDALIAVGDLEQLTAWIVVRNAVALALQTPTPVN